MRKIKDPSTLIFEGEAAGLFRPHPFEGVFSGLKKALGQQKADFGDIIFDKSTATLTSDKKNANNTKCHFG